jgi:hypothetical protein
MVFSSVKSMAEDWNIGDWRWHIRQGCGATRTGVIDEAHRTGGTTSQVTR